MGRAMLIIAAGAIIAVGILQVGVQGKRSSIAKNAAVNAYDVEMRNKAFTAAQITMEVINEHGNDAHSYLPEEVDGTPVNVGLTIIPNTSTTTFAQLEDETVVINASATYEDPTTGEEKTIDITTSYRKEAMHFVPEFKGALQFALGASDFNFSLNGSGSFVGNNTNVHEDISCPSKPSIVVKDDASYDEVDDGAIGGDLISDAGEIGIDEDLSYEPVDELVARLAGMDQTVKINSSNPLLNNNGKWDGELGTQSNPGVFIVEDYAKFNSNTTGYGIMVVRNNGAIEGEEPTDGEETTDGDDSTSGSVDLAGGFTFNGLVIFENALSMKGRGTVNINGSILVGKTDNNNHPFEFDLDASGNFTTSYSCEGEKYAQLASAMALGQNRYKRLSTYE